MLFCGPAERTQRWSPDAFVFPTSVFILRITRQLPQRRYAACPPGDGPRGIQQVGRTGHACAQSRLRFAHRSIAHARRQSLDVICNVPRQPYRIANTRETKRNCEKILASKESTPSPVCISLGREPPCRSSAKMDSVVDTEFRGPIRPHVGQLLLHGHRARWQHIHSAEQRR